jgi:hypothetical protein
LSGNHFDRGRLNREVVLTHPKSFDIIEKFHKFKVLLLPCYPRIVIWAGRGSAPRFQKARESTAVWSMGLSEVLAIDSDPEG